MHWYWISAIYLCVSESERKKMLSVLLSWIFRKTNISLRILALSSFI